MRLGTGRAAGMLDIYLVQQIINGLSIGLVYALMAIGFTLIFGVLNVVNFAHGEVYMLGAFAGLMLITGVAPPLLVVVLLVLAVGAITGVGLERMAFKPFRRFRDEASLRSRAMREATLLSSLAVSIVDPRGDDAGVRLGNADHSAVLPAAEPDPHRRAFDHRRRRHHLRRFGDHAGGAAVHAVPHPHRPVDPGGRELAARRAVRRHQYRPGDHGDLRGRLDARRRRRPPGRPLHRHGHPADGLRARRSRRSSPW